LRNLAGASHPPRDQKRTFRGTVECVLTGVRLAQLRGRVRHRQAVATSYATSRILKSDSTMFSSRDEHFAAGARPANARGTRKPRMEHRVSRIREGSFRKSVPVGANRWLLQFVSAHQRPLTLTLSPEDRGEGIKMGFRWKRQSMRASRMLKARKRREDRLQ
jgi:hypothetical protein